MSTLFLRRQQAVQRKFIAHGKLPEQLLHDLLGNAANIQPPKEGENLLQLLLRHLVAPQGQGQEFLQSSVDQIREEKGMSVDELFREVFKC